MFYIDYYACLGLSREASVQAIRQAFRRMARECHPDLCPDDPEAERRFIQISEAYEVLSDPQKRSRYDALGAQWADFSDFAESFQSWQRERHGVDYPSELFEMPFSDFYEAFFAEQPEASSVLPGVVEITLSEALTGTTRMLFQAVGETCVLEIPCGVQPGEILRQPDTGLEYEISFQPHARFRVRGVQLEGQMTVADYDAILGCHVQCETLTGFEALEIPAGSQPGHIFRLPGQGLPLAQRSKRRGDLLLKLAVMTSVNLNREERRLLERFRQLRQKR